MFLTRGQPVVYYGDEQGFTGHRRRQGRPPGHVRQRRSPSTTTTTVIGTDGPRGSADRYDTDSPAVTGHRRAGRAAQGQTRRWPTAPRSSATPPTVPASTPSPGSTPSEQVEYLVAVNNADAAGDASTCAIYDELGATFEPLYGRPATPSRARTATASVTVTVPARSAAVVRRPTATVGPAEAARPRSPSARRRPVPTVGGRTEVGVAVPGRRLRPGQLRLPGRRHHGVATRWAPTTTRRTGSSRLSTSIARARSCEYRAVLDGQRRSPIRDRAPAATVGRSGPAGVDVQAGPTTSRSRRNYACRATTNYARWDASTLRLTAAATGHADRPGPLGQAVGRRLVRHLHRCRPARTRTRSAIDKSWDENYGAKAVTNGGEHRATPCRRPTPVTFYYDHRTHWATSRPRRARSSLRRFVPVANSAAGGATGTARTAWRPGSQDPDGDGVYTYVAPD